MKLTDRYIKSIKPISKDQFISDGGGLYLRVKPSGTKTFLIRSQAGGKSSWLSIGDYPILTLLGARQKLERHTSTETTVADAYVEFDKAVLSTYKKPELSRSRFRKDVLPRIGDMPIANVTRADVFKVLQPILDRGSKVMANRTLFDVKHLFEFAVARGHIDDDPTRLITRKSCGGTEVAASTVLDFNAIRSFLQLLHDELFSRNGMGPMTIAALYVCLLTGQRASEVLWVLGNAKRGQSVIVIPAKVMKSGREHTLHLSLQVRAVIRIARGLPPPKRHNILSGALRRVEAGFTPHDLRRTFNTRLADMGVAPHLIEKILDHRMSGIMAVYNRAQYLDGRKEVLELWGRTVSDLRAKRQRPEPL